MLAVERLLVASSGILVEPWRFTWLAEGLTPEYSRRTRRQEGRVPWRPLITASEPGCG